MPIDYTSPDLSSAALVTIDTQRGTLDGQAFEIPGTSAVLPAMTALLRQFRALGKPIVHVVRIYKRDGSNVDLCRRGKVEAGVPILVEDSEGCQLAEDLLPEAKVRLDSERLLAGGIQRLGPREVVIYKPRWGAFYRTPLEETLREQGLSTLIFTGCNFPNCPRTSIYEASERDFRIIVVEDALSGLYRRGREELGAIGVELTTTESLITRLSVAS